MRRRFELRVYGYVVMPEHVHLLLSEPERRTLAEAIHYLKLSFAKRLRGRKQAFAQVRRPFVYGFGFAAKPVARVPQISRFWRSGVVRRKTDDFPGLEKRETRATRRSE